MKRKMIGVLIGVLIMLALLAGSFGCAQAPAPKPSPAAPTGTASPSPAAPAPAKVIRLKAQASWPTNLPAYGPFKQKEVGLAATFNIWLDWFNKRFNGRVVIDVAEPGALFPVAEQDLAIAKGVADMTWGYGAYYAGRIPEADIEVGGLFLFENDSQSFELLHEYGLMQEFQKVYAEKGLYWTPIHWNGFLQMGTKFPAPGPAAFKGKKIRVVGIPSAAIEVMGGIPVNIPYGETYMALKLGTVDGLVYGPAVLEELKLKEVLTGYVDEPNLAKSLSSILINPKSYASLPEDVQKALQEESPYVGVACGKAWYLQCRWAIANAEKQYGIKIYNWSAEDIAWLKEKVRTEVYPKMAAKSPASAKMIDIIQKQMRDYAMIK